MIYQPTYFSPVYQFTVWVKDSNPVFEIHDNFQKQTYRTRCNIYGANGTLSLNIPIKHTREKQHQATKEVQIENAFPWQKNHLRSLQNAYRSSPYFEYYEEDIIPLYEKKYRFLLDFLLQTQTLSLELLQWEVNFGKTQNYQKEYPTGEDMRYLADAKSKTSFKVPQYHQVFQEKHGFIPNLSILDLLFNEGPNAGNLLESF